MNLYLYSTGCVAPRPDPDEAGRHLANEPDYTGLIPPMQLRRMSKSVRTGIAAAKAALEAAGLEKPDAICIGTAMGMLADTEAFLSKMIAQEEALLTPTAFIQSTHNTVSGQIALVLSCHGHNITSVQRGLSFEHAAISAALYLEEHPAHSVLIGGLDELTNTSHALLQAGGAYAGSGGEGAAFFTAGLQARPGAWRVHALETFKGPAADATDHFLKKYPPAAKADLLLSGLTTATDVLWNPQNAFGEAAIQHFKKDTGEYATVSAQALSGLFEKKYTGSSAVIINRYLRDGCIWWLERV